MPITTGTSPIQEQFETGLARFAGVEDFRLGTELKLPLVREDGSAASRDEVDALWRFLVEERGWNEEMEEGRLVGATRPGEQNDTVGSSETGYCKTEFSLAHAADLHEIRRTLDEIEADLAVYSEANGLHFLGCGVQPVTPPSSDLMVRKKRASVWGDIFSSNEWIPEGEGDDMDLFTVNAGSHVHVSLPPEQAIDAVNVFNGFAAAQIALNGNARVWRGEIDTDHDAVSEAFWDWWAPARGRVGLPRESFADLGAYVDAIADLDLLYVKREGEPLVFDRMPALREFLAADRYPAKTLSGEAVEIEPEPGDLDLHNSCYWFNARVSRYFTVENRVNDEQPPRDLLAPTALTAGLAAALPEAKEALAPYAWDDLAKGRVDAYRRGFSAEVAGRPIAGMIDDMLRVARLGLRRRGRDEETFLAPLLERLARRSNPAREAAEIFEAGGPEALVARRGLLAQRVEKD